MLDKLFTETAKVERTFAALSEPIPTPVNARLLVGLVLVGLVEVISVDDSWAESLVCGIEYGLGWLGHQDSNAFHRSAGCDQLSSQHCSAWLTNPTPSSRGGFRKRRGSL